jgi:hypothetical protein
MVDFKANGQEFHAHNVMEKVKFSLWLWIALKTTKFLSQVAGCSPPQVHKNSLKTEKASTSM